MKRKLFLITVFISVLFSSFGQVKIVDNFTLSPKNPNVDEYIRLLVGYYKVPGLTKPGASVNIQNDTIRIVSYINSGNYKDSICCLGKFIDTINIGELGAGRYTIIHELFDYGKVYFVADTQINFQVLDTIPDTIVNCQAAFNYYFPKCKSLKCGPNSVSFNDLSSTGAIDWEWSFGDSAYSGEQNPMHQYKNPGHYYVGLRIKTANNCSSETGQYISVGMPACKANFYHYFLRCNDSLVYISRDSMTRCGANMVRFENTSEGNIESCRWEFGDGTVSDEMNPTHTYPKALKNWPVSLTIYTSDSCSSSYHDTVFMLNRTCNAAFTYSTPNCLDSTNCIGNIIGFKDLSSGDSLQWNWDFGDSTFSTVQNPVHSFSQPGLYNVCLNIKSMNGCSSNYCELVKVGNYPIQCKANFNWSELQPDCFDSIADCYIDGFFIDFENQSEGNIENWHWVFGDGACSTLQSPSHVYEIAGNYPVTLVVSGTDNCSDTYTQWITVGIPDTTICYANFFGSTDSVGCSAIPEVVCMRMNDISAPGANHWLWTVDNNDTSTLKNPVLPLDWNKPEYLISLTITTNTGCQAKISKKFNFIENKWSVVTSVKETENTNQQIELFPNPAGELVKIKVPNKINSDAVLQIIGLAGNIIDYQKVNGLTMNNNEISYNVNHLKNGNYICCIITKNSIFKGKLIVNK